MENQEEEILNDFGPIEPRRLAPVPRGGRRTVEGRLSLNISEFKKKGFLDRTGYTARIGFYHKGLRFKLVKDPAVLDWYFKLINRGPKNSCDVFALVTTKCHYGGVREWFACQSCDHRVGILYQDGDNFRCRTCLGLCYLSQKMNYRGIVPLFKRIMEFEDVAMEIRWQEYAGKPTKRAMRYDALCRKVSVAGGQFGSRW